ncbi:M3 family oligoendopeptidase [candidate division WOR-3 bacterium]|nr:M3 family oligoendopeptidase [candidate division WOR-3 bacterium]
MRESGLRPLPRAATDMLDWPWERYGPYFEELAARELTAANVEEWLSDWSALRDRGFEVYSRLGVAKDRNTADKDAEARFDRFTEETYPRLLEAEQQLKTRLLASGLSPAGFEQPLRRMRVDAALFRQENLPLFVEQQKLSKEYSQIVGRQTVTWDGREVTVSQLRPAYLERDRARREAAWRLGTARQMEDRAAVNALWRKLLELRLRCSRNAGFADYRSYRWQQMSRFDYGPEDCRRLNRAVAEVIVPAATRVYERRRRALGLDSLRPWDLNVDTEGRDPLRPFSDVAELTAGGVRILGRVDPRLGACLQTMADEGLLDLDNRKNKAPGGYCTGFAAAKRPFIFMNAVGMHRDLTVLLHEGGHAVHSFEASRLPWSQQRHSGLEFAEVASMSMELFTLPYLAKEQGGFYGEDEARRARVEQLEGILLFLPYMSVVDEFQHWLYENPEQAADPANLDREFRVLHERYLPAVDWSGLEEERATIWQRQIHVIEVPFYYIEYGLAQLGAVQVWARSLHDRPAAISAYLGALALGGTRPLPELYATAGARMAFDRDTVAAAVELVESKLTEMGG